MDKRLRVLIVEDDLIQARMLEVILESLNHVVIETIMSGEQAVDLAAEIEPDIIFTDIVLAGTMDGIEAVRKINRLSDTAIVYLTGNSWAKDSNRLKSTIYVDILIKPVSQADIKATLSKFSDKKM